jgi:hypothetical protein
MRKFCQLFSILAMDLSICPLPTANKPNGQDPILQKIRKGKPASYILILSQVDDDCTGLKLKKR